MTTDARLDDLSPGPAPTLPPVRGPRESIRYLGALALVSLGAAGFAVAFRWALALAFTYAYRAPDIVTAFERMPFALRVALPATGGLLAGFTVLATMRATGGQGVGGVMEAVVLGRVRISMRTTLFKSLGAYLAIVSGGSIGREGPLIQFGGSTGSLVARMLRLDDERSRTLIAAGTAAGFAAAYNTPLAAVLFVLEVVTGVVALEAILPAIVASAIATAVTRALAGGGPIYGLRTFTFRSSWELLAYAVLGVLAALTGQGFMRLLAAGEAFFAKTTLPTVARTALGGAIVGAIAIAIPRVTGNGYEPLNAMLNTPVPFAIVLTLLVAKAVATTASVSSGSPGGVFTPTLFLGAALGACFEHVLRAIFGVGSVGDVGAYALVGMAAMTAATTHAPLMAAVLVFELSADYAIVLPLLLATSVAVSLSRRLGPDSIYTSELTRRGVRWVVNLGGRTVVKP